MKSAGTTLKLETMLKAITKTGDEVEDQDPQRILTREEAYGVRDCFNTLMEMVGYEGSKYHSILIQLFGGEEALLTEVRGTIHQRSDCCVLNMTQTKDWQLEFELSKAPAA